MDISINTFFLCPVNILLFKPLLAKAVFSYPLIPLTIAMLITWEIVFIDRRSCSKAYRKDRNKTGKINCIDERITWVSQPDQNAAHQIDPVTISHDEYYVCTHVVPDGNSQHGYHLPVLDEAHRLAECYIQVQDWNKICPRFWKTFYSLAWSCKMKELGKSRKQLRQNLNPDNPTPEPMPLANIHCKQIINKYSQILLLFSIKLEAIFSVLTSSIPRGDPFSRDEYNCSVQSSHREASCTDFLGPKGDCFAECEPQINRTVTCH